MIMTEEFKKGMVFCSSFDMPPKIARPRCRHCRQGHCWKCILVRSLCETWFLSQVSLLLAGDRFNGQFRSSDQMVCPILDHPLVCSTGIRAGTVESRIRQLIMKLEYVESLTLAHPFIKGFDQVAYCLNEEEVRAIAQGETSPAIAARKKEDVEGKEGAGPVYSTTFYIGLMIEPKQRTLFHTSRSMRMCWHLTVQLAPLDLDD